MHIRSFKGTAGFSTWLYRIAYNVFYDFLKKTNRETSVDMMETIEFQPQYQISDSVHQNIDVYNSLNILRN